MKPKQILIGAIIVICAGVGLFALVKHHGTASGSDESGDENVPTVISVQVGVLTNLTLHQYIDGYGTVEPSPGTANLPAAGGMLAAPTAGVVAKVNVIAGQSVNKGDVLVELNSPSATFDYAKAEVERQQKLLEQQNTSLKNLQDAQAQLISLEVIAPVSGTVTSVNVKPGQAVDVNTVVAEVIDLNRLVVNAKIPAEQAVKLQAGQEVQIQTDPPLTTTLSFVSPTVNADDGTIATWAALPSDSQLRPGQFVQLKIITAIHTNSLAAPAQSVVTDEDGNSSIWLVNGDDAAQTTVQTGLREDNWAEIQATNLQAGDQVVTVGAYGLPDKTKIKIVNPSDEASNSPAQ